VICKRIGGGFGGKGSNTEHAVAIAVAAKKVNRPVKMTFNRDEDSILTGTNPKNNLISGKQKKINYFQPNVEDLSSSTVQEPQKKENLLLLILMP
jgi:hypothetical protein